MKKISYNLLRSTIELSTDAWVFGTYGGGFFGNLIKLFTQSSISHVGVLVFFYGRLWCVEMRPNGCILTPAGNRFKNGQKIVIGRYNGDRLIYIEKKDKYCAKVLDEVNKRQYDKFGVVVAWFYATKGAKEFCSRWTARVTGMKFPTLTRGITPSDVIEKCDETFILKY